jgi:exo-beta-1,3-glucanase (GH17 family)
MRIYPALVAAWMVLISGCAAQANAPSLLREEPFVIREFRPFSDGRWIGNAIAYGPYRDGQFPGGPSPSREELRQDLHLMAEHWSLLRLYGSAGPSETILEIIKEDKLEMRVMLGVWIGAEERGSDDGGVPEKFPEIQAENRQEVESAIRLAGAFPGVVIAISVGNEAQVFWSGHRSPAEVLIGYVREVRAGTSIPVTVADDFNFWNKAKSRAVAGEVDFLVTHAHPLWNGIQIENALDWTTERLEEVQKMHPQHTIVLGETGWATRKHNQGEQAELIKGHPGEEEQKLFYEAVTAWAREARVTVFFFEAFDENWKGGEHPDEVEKHWGLFQADRTPKQALAETD